MPKSIAEIERLKINAQAQNHLINAHLKSAVKETSQSINLNQSKDVYQPTGDIDYSRFNKSAKS